MIKKSVKLLLPLILIIIGMLTSKVYANNLVIPENPLLEMEKVNKEYIARNLKISVDENGVINIDDLLIGSLVEHEHVYEHKYNSSYHWEECVMCGKQINQSSHHLAKRGGKNGKNFCGGGGYNQLQYYCSDGCGYSYNVAPYGHSWYMIPYSDVACHGHACRECGWNSSDSRCYNANGYINDGWGTCSVCGSSFQPGHRGAWPRSWKTGNSNVGGKAYCTGCGDCVVQQSGPVTIRKIDARTIELSATVVPAMSGITINYNTLNFGTWSGLLPGHSMEHPGTTSRGTYGSGGATITQRMRIPNGNRASAYSIILQGTYNENSYIDDGEGGYYENKTHYFTIYVSARPVGNFTMWGEKYTGTAKIFYQTMDYSAPIFQEASVIGNGTSRDNMSTKAVVNIRCYEEWNDSYNYVSVRLLDTDGKTVIHDWKQTTKSGNKYSTQIDFVGEVFEPKTYYIEAKDSCLNVSRQAVTLQYIDSRAPQLKKDETVLVYNNPWTKTKDITIVATDYGVEDVQMAFNEYTESALKKAVKIRDHVWAMTWTVTGDIYKDVQARIYARDAAGNRDTIATVTIGKLDITPPTVEDIDRRRIDDEFTEITIHANDYCEKRKIEGSGVYQYAIAYSKTMPTNPNAWQSSPVFKIKAKTKYWVWVKDVAGNITYYIPEEIYLDKQYKEIENDKVNSRGQVTDNGKGWNHVNLSWGIYNNEVYIPVPEDPYTFEIQQRRQDETDFKGVLTTTDFNAKVETAIDVRGPERPLVSLSANDDRTRLKIGVRAEDVGTLYELRVKGTTWYHVKYSNIVSQEIKVGVKGFGWIITDSQTLTQEQSDSMSVIRELPEDIDYETNLNKWLHIRGIDWAGNLGVIASVQITEGEVIPREELKEKLFCIEYGKLIPALDDGTQIDATVKLESRDGNYRDYVTVKTPTLRDIIGRRFVSPVMTADGKIDQRYRDAVSNSIGRYNVNIEDTTKNGVATEKEAYILSYWDEHTSVESYVQYALYSTEIALRNNSNYNWPQTDKSRALLAEAENYEAYRKAWYTPRKIEHEEKVSITEDYVSHFVGPFELDYSPEAVQITIGEEKRQPVYFFKIAGAKIYDRDGKLIGQKDENGNTIRKTIDENGNVIDLIDWEFEYITKGYKRDNELFSYDNYKFPVNEEEFYIKIDNLPENINGISKIEYEYKKLKATAKYELLQGTYYKVKWEANEIGNQNREDAIWCEGGKKCAHKPHHDKPTLVGGYVYLTSTKFTQTGIDSQKLLRVLESEKYYEQYVQTVYPNKDSNSNPNEWKLTVDVNGSIWDDGIEDQNNGLKEDDEKPVNNVKIIAHKVDKNKNRIGKSYETRTDEAGNYTYKDMQAGLYDIEFEYDGQTYKTTKILISGNLEDYKEYYEGTKYVYDSIAEETRVERQNLNDRYEEIYADSKSRDGKGNVTHDLEYSRTEGTSTIITSDNRIVRDQYALQARTSTYGVFYPIVPREEINKYTVMEVKDIYNANLGLVERIKTDENLGVDVYRTIFGIKGLIQDYIYSGKDLRNINSQRQVENYVQKINEQDYTWKWNEELAEVWDSGEESELRSYIDYMIVIRNSGEKDFVRISELADYYSDNLEYSNDGYKRDVLISSYGFLKWDKAEENKDQVIQKLDKITWNKNSKYGYKNENMKGYNDIYTTDLETFELQKGQFIEVHIIFRVNQKEAEEIGQISGLDIDKDFENYSEVMGYKTYYISDRSVAGLIDLDSRPGNMTPSIINKEDDEDKAPNMKYEIEKVDIYDPNADNSDGDNNGDESGENEGNGGSDKKKNYGNVLEGNVWEDLREGDNTLLKANNQRVADGIMQEDETKVNYVQVELIEMFTKKNGDTLEILRQTVRTNPVFSINKGQKEGGGYCFANLSSGKYKIHFTFGDYEQIEKEIKYNGQDYQAKYTPDLYGGEFEDDFSNVEIMLAIDVSTSMTGEPLEKEKQSLIKLVNELTEKLPKVNIGLIKFSTLSATVESSTNNKDRIINSINKMNVEENTNITLGIKTALNEYIESDKVKNRVMVLITDGQETVTSTEEVKRALELAVDQKEIKLVTLLTKENEDIFGTVQTPTRGKLYLLDQDNKLEEAIKVIEDEILEDSVVEDGRSLTHEVEGNKENPEKGTRWYNLINYEIMNSKKGKLLAIEKIANMPETTEEERKAKTERMKEYADETYMRAESDISVFKPNNVGKTRLHQMNLSLEERPKVELQLEAEIRNIRITLSDGTVIIDTEKGMTKNVMGFGHEEKLPISVYIDEELMQGAEVRIEYAVKIENIGEIDTLSNYIKGESDKTIATTPTVAYNYTYKNMLYREDDLDKRPMWAEIKRQEAYENLTEDGQEEIDKEKDLIKIYSTEELAKALYPKDSIEAKEQGAPTFVEARAVMSKLLSPNNDDDALTYKCAIEIIERQNDAGRRSYRSIPGNYYKGTDEIEPDMSITQSLIITKPLGEKAIQYQIYVITLIGLAIVIYVIIRKTKKKTEVK